MRFVIVFALASVLSSLACGSEVETTAGTGTTGTTGAGGGGGAGGSVPATCPTPGTLGFEMYNGCSAAQEGLECPWVYADTGGSADGVVECVSGTWEAQSCPSFYTLGCPSAGSPMGEPCSAAWEGKSCPWYWADAGGNCEGTAVCDGGSWIAQ